VSNPKILVVEDEAVVAEDVRIKLKGLQYDVAAVTGSGEEAVKLAETERPDLVLMDIRLEGPIDGPEAAQRIRDRLGIPVVYVTAYADDRTLARAKITGARQDHPALRLCPEALPDKGPALHD